MQTKLWRSNRKFIEPINFITRKPVRKSRKDSLKFEIRNKWFDFIQIKAFIRYLWRRAKTIRDLKNDFRIAKKRNRPDGNIKKSEELIGDYAKEWHDGIEKYISKTIRFLWNSNIK